MTQYDMKLQILLDPLIPLWSHIQIQWERYEQETTAISHRSSFVSEQELLQGKIIIEHLALPERLDISPLRDAIVSYQQRHTELQTTLRSVQGQQQSLQTALSSLRQQLSTKTKESDDIQVQLDRYSDGLFQEVTIKLQDKQIQRSEYINSIDLSQEFATIQNLSQEAKTQQLRDIFAL
jgi:chromosome segregation ATPase